MAFENYLWRELGSSLVVEGTIMYNVDQHFTYIKLDLENLCCMCKEVLAKRGGNYVIKVDSLGE